MGLDRPAIVRYVAHGVSADGELVELGSHDELLALGQRVNAGTRSMGMALSGGLALQIGFGAGLVYGAQVEAGIG